MIYAETATEIATRRKGSSGKPSTGRLSFPPHLRKWRLKCRPVADSLEQAGDRLFTFTGLPPEQWRSARTTNAIERLNEGFRRRIKTQTVLPCVETVPMLLWALLASGQRLRCARSTDGKLSPSPSNPSRLTTPHDQAEITQLGEPPLENLHHFADTTPPPRFRRLFRLPSLLAGRTCPSLTPSCDLTTLRSTSTIQGCGRPATRSLRSSRLDRHRCGRQVGAPLGQARRGRGGVHRQQPVDQHSGTGLDLAALRRAGKMRRTAPTGSAPRPRQQLVLVVFVDARRLPWLRPGRHLDREPAARGGRQPEFGHELRHQLQLPVGDGEPGRRLNLAGRRLQQRRRLGELPLGLYPAAIGLAVGRHRARSAGIGVGNCSQPANAKKPSRQPDRAGTLFAVRMLASEVP
jgi:Transposase, Mutator family